MHEELRDKLASDSGTTWHAPRDEEGDPTYFIGIRKSEPPLDALRRFVHATKSEGKYFANADDWNAIAAWAGPAPEPDEEFW